MKQVDTILSKAHSAWQNPQVKQKINLGLVFSIISTLIFSIFLNFYPQKANAAIEQPKQLHTVEFNLGGSSDNATRTTGTTVFAGSSWNTTKASAGTRTVELPGSGITVKHAYIKHYFNTTASANTTNIAVALDVSNGPAPGTMVRIAEELGVTTWAASGQSYSMSSVHDATALFDRQTDSQFNTGLSVVASAQVTGPSTRLSAMKLIITYESDYSSTPQTALKTVRFPLSSTQSGDTGSRTTTCPASTACDFAYNANIPDATADANIKSVWFEFGGEVDSGTASTITPTIVGGTAGPAFNWTENTADDQFHRFVFTPTVGGTNFQRNTNQTLRLTTGTVPISMLGGELIVTYQYSTGAATQTETISYMMNQETANPGTTKNTFSKDITISNAGRSVSNLWYQVDVAPTAPMNISVFGTVGANTEKSNTYTVTAANARAGGSPTIIYDMSADKASFNSATTTISGAVQHSATGGSPPGVKLFLTFTWSGSTSSTQTKTVAFSGAQQGANATTNQYYNKTVHLTLPEKVTKTYWDSYVEIETAHSQATSITIGTITTGVNTATGTAIAETADTTSEAYWFRSYYNIDQNMFSGGATIPWQTKAVVINQNKSMANTVRFSNEVYVTYDAAMGEAAESELTVDTWGTQVSTLYYPSSNNYIGGAFTMSLDQGTTNVTSIKISEKGTVNANSNLSNARLYYETVGTCSYNGGESQFGTSAGFNISDEISFTGSASVSTDQVCFYLVFDIGSGVSAGQTVEIEITNPSVDVTVASGSVAPATAVAISGTTTISSGNTVPNNPSSLTQKTSPGNVDIAEGAWTNDNTPTLGFTITDPDGDTVKYRIQIDGTSSSFSNLVLDYTHGSLSSSGTTFSYTIGQSGGTYTVGSQSMTLPDSATGYWWRVQAIDEYNETSSYVQHGVAGTVDFKVDATPPTGGTVNDGTGADVDYNDGSLTTLSANWSGFDSSVSGLNKYQYAIGTTQGGTNVVNWTDNSTNTSVTNNSLSLRTSQKYYFSVRAVDNAGNTSNSQNSNGQEVLPQISFVLNESSVTFNNLNNANNWTDTKTSSFTILNTNAYGGYSVIAYATDFLRSLTSPSYYIDDFQGTYSVPETWSPPGDSKYGFGYSTSDCDVNSGLFWSSPSCGGSQKFARFTRNLPGHTIADHLGPIIGSPITNETFTVTYRVAVQPSQAASTYQNRITYIIAPNF